MAFKLRAGERLLDVDGESWSWRWAHILYVRRPDDKVVAVSTCDFTGMDHNTIERDSYKRSFSVKPRDVVAYIRKHRVALMTHKKGQFEGPCAGFDQRADVFRRYIL